MFVECVSCRVVSCSDVTRIHRDTDSDRRVRVVSIVGVSVGVVLGHEGVALPSRPQPLQLLLEVMLLLFL